MTLSDQEWELLMSIIRSQKSLIQDLSDELDFWQEAEGFVWGPPELKEQTKKALK